VIIRCTARPSRCAAKADAFDTATTISALTSRDATGAGIAAEGAALKVDKVWIIGTKKTASGLGGHGVVVRKGAGAKLSGVKLKQSESAGLLVDDPGLSEQGGLDVEMEGCEVEGEGKGVVVQGEGMDDDDKAALAGEIAAKNSFQMGGKAVETEADEVPPGDLCEDAGCENEAPPSGAPDEQQPVCEDPNVDNDGDGTPDCDEQAQCPPGADGFGDDKDSKALCAPAAPYNVTVGGDCNDTQASIRPGQPELCDGIDNNCDGATDDRVDGPGCQNYYPDTDGDTYGAGHATCACAAPDGFVENDIDFNDADAQTHPAANDDGANWSASASAWPGSTDKGSPGAGNQGVSCP
jgi:hypothetical protein